MLYRDGSIAKYFKRDINILLFSVEKVKCTLNLLQLI